MKIRGIPKKRSKKVKVKYEGTVETKDQLRFIELPFEDQNPEMYLQSNIRNISNIVVCGRRATPEEVRYCWVMNRLISQGIKYTYYTGHQRHWTQVLIDGMGNAHDLSRLVDKICEHTGLLRRYGNGKIRIGGVDYDHVWNEFKVDHHWEIFDAVSLLTGRGVNNVFGHVTMFTGYTGEITMSGWRLMETKTLPGGTINTTFSGLNGNVDGEYLIKYDINLSGTGDKVLHILPNNDTGATREYMAHEYGRDGTTSFHSSGINSIAIGMGIGLFSISHTFAVGNSILKASTGRVRIVTTEEYDALNLTRNFRRSLTGTWSDTTSNIISLVIALSAGSMSGTISLYRWVD